MAPVFCVRREGPDRASAQLKVQSQIVDYFLREQANQIGITGEICLILREHLLRRSGTADVIISFQEQDAQSGPRQITGRDQAVVAGAENNNIIFVSCLGHGRYGRDLTRAQAAACLRRCARYEIWPSSTSCY